MDDRICRRGLQTLISIIIYDIYCEHVQVQMKT